MSMFAAVVRVTVLALPCLTLALPAAGQQVPRGYAREGAYVGIAPQVDATLDGVSFDGLTVYERVGGTELAILPKLDRKTMIRAIVGFRSRPMAIEFSVERARHGGRFDDLPAESVFTAFNVDGRFFFLTDRRVQPHLVLGISVPMLRVDDGSFDDPLVGDARWRGTGLNTEFGVTVFANARLGVSVGYVYRPMWFTTVRGVHDEPLELEPEFRETSTNPTVMMFWTF